MYEPLNQIPRGGRHPRPGCGPLDLALLCPQVQPQEVHPTPTVRLPGPEGLFQDRLPRHCPVVDRPERLAWRLGTPASTPLHDAAQGLSAVVDPAPGQPLAEHHATTPARPPAPRA